MLTTAEIQNAVWTAASRTLTSGGGGSSGGGGGFGGLPPAVFADGNVAPTRLDQIMLSIQGRLGDYLGLPAERVLLVEPEMVDQHPHGDQYVCVWPDLESTVLFPGAGRLDTREMVRVFVCLRTRKALDEASNSGLWLTDRVDAAAGDNVGHLVSRHAIYDALVGYQLTTDGTEQGSWLVDRPIVPRTASRPRRERPDKEWGESTMAFDITYILNLSQDYQ